MEQEQQREVKGIWIPIDIWQNKELNWSEKILLLEIDSFTSQNKDCFFSDERIAEFLGINKTNANKTLASLIRKGYVIKTRFDGRRRYIKSALSQTTTLPCREQQTSCVCDNNNIYSNSIITKPTTKEENEDNKLSSQKKGALDLSIVSAEMRDAVETWLAYKREKGQTYKPMGFKTFYKRLCELSGGNPHIAMQIVENSMQNNYAGIFPLNNHQPQTNGREERAKDAADLVSRLLAENDA